MKFKFIKLTNYDTNGNLLVNVNDIVFVSDELEYREVHIQLHDRVLFIKVKEEINEIYGFIEANKTYQPIFD